jgi:putative flippase GtrA
MRPAGNDIRAKWRVLQQEFGCFLVVGATAAAIHWGVLWVGIVLFNLEGTLSTTLGFIISAIVSYLLNYFWTFRSTASHARAFVRFFVVAVCGLLLNAAIFAGVKYGWQAHFFMAQGVATGIVLFWHFSMYRIWSFRP